jgi:5'-nucleotidase (lipoprotein e(P4) family)
MPTIRRSIFKGSIARGCCLVLVSSLFAGCATAPQRQEPPAATPGVDANLNAVAWMQTSVEHDMVYRSVYRGAADQLLRALADPEWDALPTVDRERSASGLPPAVIVDIDETVLDNSAYQARLLRDGTRYEKVSWNAWCREKAATALPGAVEFAQLAARHGVTVFYVSNRAEEVAPETLENLRTAGFPIAAGADVFLGQGRHVEGCTPADRSDKSCRRRLVGRGHRVLLQLGDQLGDFFETGAATPAERRAAATGQAQWFGERWFMLPNPSYGNWEPALFGNDWSLPAADQRARKLNNLVY